MAGQYTRPGPTVALIQGSIDVEVKTDENQLEDSPGRVSRFVEASAGTAAEFRFDGLAGNDVSLPAVYFTDDFHQPADWAATPQEWYHKSRKNLQDLQDQFRRIVDEKFQSPLPPPLLLGFDAVHFSNGPDQQPNEQHFNSATFIDPQGKCCRATTKCTR